MCVQFRHGGHVQRGLPPNQAAPLHLLDTTIRTVPPELVQPLLAVEIMQYGNEVAVKSHTPRE